MQAFERLRTALADRYRIEHELGRGATATVYRAHDLKHGRAVALKVLHPELARSIGAERFLREIRTTAQLTHPHILTMHDSGGREDLLYYVLPYVDGGSLFDRLASEGRLRVAEAVALAVQVCEALAYAHERGVVHRDVKPENILFVTSTHVCLADFGLARALSAAACDRLTATGLAVGSPLYMSPEQVAGEKEVDGRSDIYALGCVLYEMLAGRPPFPGGSVQSVLSRQLVAEAPELSDIRPEVPRSVAAAVHRSLRKDPADRFGDAAAFNRALSGADGASADARGWWRIFGAHIPGWRIAIVAAAVVVLVGAALIYGLLVGIEPVVTALRQPIDTTRFLLLPIESPVARGSAERLDRLLAEEFRSWSGIGIVDPLLVQDALEDSRPPAPITLARRSKAGRFLRASLSGDGAGGRVQASLFDATRRGASIRTASIALGADSLAWRRPVAELVDSLLFAGTSPIVGFAVVAGTRSVPARHAFGRGHAALRAGDAAEADSAFAEASRLDPAFAHAFLWLAQTRLWTQRGVDQWKLLVDRALANVHRLDARSHILALALRDLAAERYPEACRAYRSLIERAAEDFVAWYGLGECLRRDGVVLADRASSTGWSFRSSHEAALRAYERAFSLHLSMLAFFSGGGYATLRNRMYTTGTQVRSGTSPDGRPFLAFPSWQGDSLALVPHPREAFDARGANVVPSTHALAVSRQQRRFDALTNLWATEMPASTAAQEARAIALEMLGDARAITAFRNARRLASDSTAAARLAAAEVWLLFKGGLPEDTTSTNRARLLADSLLAATAHWQPRSRYFLASLAVLAGQPDLGASLAAFTPDLTWESYRWPERLRENAQLLNAHAALGGPVETIRSLEQRIEADIETALPPVERDRARTALLRRAATLAYPVHQLRHFDALAAADGLLATQHALAHRDTLRAKELLAALLRGSAALRTSELTLDATLLQAHLLVQLNDPHAAARLADARLGSLANSRPQLLADFVEAACLLRLVRLRDSIQLPGSPYRRDRWEAALPSLLADTVDDSDDRTRSGAAASILPTLEAS